MKRSLVSILMLSSCLWAQQKESPVLRGADSLKMFTRSVELAEATAIAVPHLQRASGPLLEEARANLRSLERSAGQQHIGYSYALMTNLRAYLDLADSMPKPVPFPESSRKQFDELRANMDRLDVHFRGLLDAREVQVRGSDRDNLQRYAEANTRLGAPQPGKQRVVFLGDSITDGWRLNEYFPDKDYVNRGISGQITGEMLGRMKADVIGLNPAAVVILAGTNDLARGVAIPTIVGNYTMIADLADAYKIKLIFASVLPISDYHKDKNLNYEQSTRRPPALIRGLNDWLYKFCNARGYTYLNYYVAMVDGNGFIRADFADDGLHPNSAGYRIMAPLAQAAVDKTLKAPAPPPLEPAKKRRFGLW